MSEEKIQEDISDIKEEAKDIAAQLKEQVAELKDSLARTQADYANYRRRTEEQQQQMKQLAAKSVLMDVIGVLDNLQLALTQSTQDDTFHTGVEMIYSQLISMIEEHGAQRIEEDDFNPLLHEAILSEPSDKPKGTIIEVLQHGYRLGDTVLRTAKVKVSSGVKDNE